MKFEGIMKVQIPVSMTEGAGPMGIAYSEDRQMLFTFDPAIVAGKMGDTFPESHKRFFHCTIDDNGKLTIGKRAPWQEW